MSSSNQLENIKKLREITGAGFKDCSVAIKECNGDVNKSIEYLRIKGISKANKKMQRTANDGLVCIYEKNEKTSILEINCETDFVAKNIEFLNFAENLSELCFKQSGNLDNLKKAKMKNGNTVDENVIGLISKIGEKITIRRTNFFENKNCINFCYIHTSIKEKMGKLGVVVSLESQKFTDQIKDFGHKLAMHVAASSPLAIDITDLDKDVVEKEKSLINEELKNSKKNREITEKISKGKIEKFKQDNTLVNQAWIMDPKKKVKDIINSLDKENRPKIKDFVRYKVGE